MLTLVAWRGEPSQMNRAAVRNGGGDALLVDVDWSLETDMPCACKSKSPLRKKTQLCSARAARPEATGGNDKVENLSYYDTSPLKDTLEELIDFDYLNEKHVRLIVSHCVNVKYALY